MSLAALTIRLRARAMFVSASSSRRSNTEISPVAKN